MKKRYTFVPKNWLRTGLFAVFAFSCTLSLQAQNGPAKQWDKTFGGNNYDWLFSLQQTSDGGYILGGSSDSGISGDKSQASRGRDDFWIVKLDVNGNKQWDKTFGGNFREQLTSLQQTADGGYILGGTSGSGISGEKSQPSQGAEDYWVVKIDAAGNKVWDRSFGGNLFEHLQDVKQTTDGGYILGGYSYSGISGDKTQALLGDYDYWAIKLDGSGNKIWDKTFGGSDYDGLMSVQQTLDGGYILGGFSGSGISSNKTQPSQGGGDYWIIKLDGSGNKIWDKTIGGSGEDALNVLKQTADGGFILGGFSNSGISGNKTEICKGGEDFWIVKTDGSGNLLWNKTFGGTDNETLNSLQETVDGGFILGGSSISGQGFDKSEVSRGNYDYWIVKCNSSGSKIWDKTFGGNDADFFGSLQQTSDGGYLLGGESFSGISSDKSQPVSGNSDIWIVKLAPDILGTEEQESNSPISIFPNPNQGKFNLQLSDLTSAKAEVTISDLLGRVIFQQEFKTANNQLSEEINLPNAKGIYLLQLKTGEQISTRKIVVE